MGNWPTNYFVLKRAITNVLQWSCFVTVSVTASRLTTMLQGSGSHLSRHVSSVGEHVSSSFSLMPLPKRAETFAGFDSSFDVPKGCVPKKKYLSDLQDMDGRSDSPQNIDSDPEMSHGNDSGTYDKVGESAWSCMMCVCKVFTIYI